MNILITLPKNLINKIISGEKKFEMRKRIPKNMKLGEDGFFVVEKGTDEVKCWCRVDKVTTLDLTITEKMAKGLSKDLCVSQKFIIDYASVSTKVYLWEISKVVITEDLCRNSLGVDKNPQQFAYCPLSYGESY